MTATSQPIGNPYLDVAAPQAKPVLVQKWVESVDNIGKSGRRQRIKPLNIVFNRPSCQTPLPEAVIQRGGRWSWQF